MAADKRELPRARTSVTVTPASRAITIEASGAHFINALVLEGPAHDNALPKKPAELGSLARPGEPDSATVLFVECALRGAEHIESIDVELAAHACVHRR